MKKKIISILVLVLIVGAFITNHLITYAGKAEPPLYVKLAPADLSGVGYGNGNPVIAGSNKNEYIWNIITQDSETGPASQEQRNLYCVKAEYGETWFGTETKTGNANEILEYNLYYDMQVDEENREDRAKLLANLQDNGNDADDVVKTLLDPTGSQYRELLWLLDHAYIPNSVPEEDKQEYKESYLESVGIYKDEYEGSITYETETEIFGESELADTDIIAIQKMAIWYFTNGAENDNYDKTAENLTQWLFISEDDGETYKALSEIDLDQSRNKQANYLYRHLINSAKAGANQYTAENGYKVDGAPVSVNGNTTDKQERINTTRLDSNYLIGPITIEKNNELGCNITITVKNQSQVELKEGDDYVYSDAQGNKLENITSEKDLVGIDGGFYISVPRSKIENVSISVKVEYKTTPKKLWLQGTEDVNTNVIKLNAEQPLVEVNQDPKDFTVQLTSEPKEFDLALRKYITAVNGTNITNSRIPNISLGTLLTGTTATYNHRKDPVVVEDKDEITYNITIYNEGNKAGYATKIIDQLPTGLISSTNNSSVVTSKGPNGEERNKYNLQYDTTNNQIVLTLVQWPEELEGDTTQEGTYVKDIEPYTTGNLDYETIEIKCMVAQEPDTKNDIVLTNVAWIANAYDSEAQQEISAEGTTDRDSEPGTIPDVNKEDMEDYKGKDTNKDDLGDDTYHYKGQQDDDDFEKIVIIHVEKKFDLALVKFIVAVSDDQTIEDNEYLKEEDGTYSRAPEVKLSETGELYYDFTNRGAKNPLIVEPGDYVLYTIRVYNEGEVNGYASKIRDELPEGLEFVIGDTTYNGIWDIEEETLNNEERVEVTTDWYAKGNAYETLLTAFNKENAINDENPDYLDAQILCKVTEQAGSNRVLVNYAQISDDSDENGDPIDDIDSTPDEWIDNDEHQDDDQDIEKVQLKYFDLSLRKFVTAVNGKDLKDSDGKFAREPVVDVTPLKNGTGTTAIYTHSKKPLAVQVGDKIVYTIRAYNEGSINGFANEVKDYLPPYLTYAKDSEINEQYGWQLSEDGRIATTTYLSNTELKAFNGTELDYADLKIECIVSETAPLKENQTNIAEISEYKYNGNIAEKDIDSVADNMVSADKLPSDEELPQYKNEEINNSYVPGNEDDDDFEKVYVKEFDLALRKFITKIQEKEVTTRVPQVKIENGTISYEHSKDALTVHVGDVVTYTLRIYNEGEISGYASEITDDIPEYLEYLPEDSTNVEYMWKMYDENGNETESVEQAVKVKTKYLSKENGEKNLIKAFDGTTLDYKDIKISFKVKDPNSNTYIITNHAQISDDADENGNVVEDKDSTPNQWIDNEQHKDDDQDIENVKVEYFDLSILKFVSKVIVTEKGKETITETGYNGHENPEPVVKVELHKKKLSDVVVKFVYGITVTNEGDIPGYATELTDYVPEGLKFVATDNPDWTDEGNNVISTKQLENTLLQPGQSETIEVMFTWINGKDNLALKTNTVEISEDKNEYDVPDRDSTPDNKKEGEDDIDIAKVILAITTGRTQTYFMLTLGLLTIVLVGVVLIKKFVI